MEDLNTFQVFIILIFSINLVEQTSSYSIALHI